MKSTKNQNVMFTNHVGDAIDRYLSTVDYSGLYVLVDTNTHEAVLPRLQLLSKNVATAKVIVTPAGDNHKDIDAVSNIWKQLGDLGATRQSILINLGGGVITDMGAFAASTFKRGIRFINVPTTLLAAVDAAVGGKTGFNFNGLKNEIGVFADASLVIISTLFFVTLSATELRSGYAEMLKHGLLTSNEEYHKLLNYSIEPLDTDSLLALLQKSVDIKGEIVAQDPHESGIRRALNLGHTVGHAFESMSIERKAPVPHGYAVAYGLVVATILSHMKLGFPSSEIHTLAAYVKLHYGIFHITCDDYPELLRLMSHDKKNSTPGVVNFTLLKAVGEVETGVGTSAEEITAALDIYRDLFNI